MTNARNTTTGFTLVELMVVVSVVSILAVIAVPIYLNYMIRSKVSEGMVFVSEARTSVAEYYSNTNLMPQNNSEAGLPAPDDYDNLDYVSRLEVGSTPPDASILDGTITVTFKISQLGSDNLLQLIPSTTGGHLTWTCEPPATNGMRRAYVPPNCRG